MIEIFHEFGFESAHFLPKVPEGHPCGRVHGHSYRLTVTLGGDLDPELGWVCDFAEVQQAWKPLFAQLDHHMLNEIEGLENPTAEIIAQWIADRLGPALPQLLALTLRETADTGVTIRCR